jgi:biopolymer transport protein TolR
MAGAPASSFADEDGMVCDINVTPLVDVVLVLLIVFMTTAPAIIAFAPIKVDLPETKSAPVQRTDETQRLEIYMRRQSSGEITIYAGEHRLSGDLKAALSALPLPPSDQPARITADRGIDYGEVVKVIDLLGSLGIKKLVLNTRHGEGLDAPLVRPRGR